eukprot:Phypoly_transcript_13685.p1 GENE.Phypoly_transcript_13685~~Phypoly_transcript_13685.p1  ORF type:complete len:126 (-),score=21.35 Phypoly_transcript_13685:138-515(-)
MDLITKAQEGALIWTTAKSATQRQLINISLASKEDHNQPHSLVSLFLNLIEYTFNKLKINIAWDNFTNTKELMDSIKQHIPEIRQCKGVSDRLQSTIIKLCLDSPSQESPSNQIFPSHQTALTQQ